jgi:hypothetical protein
MVEDGKKIVVVGTYYKDDDGAGRIYTPKELADSAPFENKDKLRMTLDKAKGEITIEKFI